MVDGRLWGVIAASSEGKVGAEELPAEHLARLRESDALLHVVRAFEDPNHPHPDGSVDPARDLERLDFEFVIADLALQVDDGTVLLAEVSLTGNQLKFKVIGGEADDPGLTFTRAK